MEDHIPPAIALDVSPMRTMVTSRRDETEVVIPDVIPDVTFDLTGPQFQGASAPLEQSLPDRELTDDIPDDTHTTYEIVEAGTKRGAPKLVGSDGYTYTRGVLSSGRRYWRCAVRNKKMVCPASVKQYIGMFNPCLGGHVHPADPGAAQKVKMARKDIAKERMFEPAAAIVERVMREMLTPDDVNLPKPDNLTRVANHHRRLRPDDPTDLSFELDQNFIGKDFIIDDIQLNEARHIVFGTKLHMDLLRQSKRWFPDGTFKVVRVPFYQLLSVNVFVKKGDDEKQVPLTYPDVPALQTGLR